MILVILRENYIVNMCKQYDNSRQNADLENCDVKMISWLLL